LRSADPFDAPIIDPNYMDESVDWREMRSAVELARAVVHQKAFDAFRGRELKPGPEVQSTAQIDAFIRRTSESGYHPCGTCRIGSPAEGVVDPEGRVHGVSGLRVADASIMPSIVSGNLNAPCMMIGEKIAQSIIDGKGDR
jgi:choline dehydrogenase